jgi:PAB-dependent poly(A)-specific ribonuclease subunit 2
MKNLRCASFTSKASNEMLVAGSQDQMFTIDVAKGEITKKVREFRATTTLMLIMQIPTTAHYTILRRSRYICAALTDGNVHILDPTTFSVIKKWQAHSALISDMDAQHDFIVTCGYSLRQGQNYMHDPLVNVFDLKNLVAIPPIPFPSGAAFVRMHPRMLTTSIVTSQMGQIHVVDLMNVNTSNIKHANVPNYLTKIEIAPSGEAIALASGDCNILLWGSPSRIRFAELANPVEFTDHDDLQVHLDWEGNT